MAGAVTARASAPARLDLAGGWTDVAPFATERGGLVVNAAIELRAHAEVEPGGAGFRLESRDLGRSVLAEDAASLARPGELELLRAAVRASGTGPCRVTTWADAPPGSGLGCSGALDVALVAALDAVQEARRPAVDLAEAGWRLETIEAGLPGGKQDQYAAALGGFHRIELDGDGVVVERLRLDPNFEAELARRTVVCYTGQSRVSSSTIERVMSSYRRRESRVTAALSALVETADRMVAALLAADLGAVAALLSENWRWQQALDDGMQTPGMARLESAMRDAGALGGKAAGAGAGGSMFFVMGGDPEPAIRAAAALGMTVLPLAWAGDGVRLW